jgi:hypothetical protein
VNVVVASHALNAARSKLQTNVAVASVDAKAKLAVLAEVRLLG